MLGIIIQARTGSTRLPSKMLMDFYKGSSLIEIIIQRIKSFGIDAKIILATTSNKNDDVLQQIAEKQGILYYRGDENNVLNRFINASEEHEVDNIIRVCADNPFIDEKFFKEILVNDHGSDYCSYFMDELTPVIKTHFGFFVEKVTLNALRKVSSLTDNPLYKEHVTNYIYSHPEFFTIKKIGPPEYILANRVIRLTIDRAQDFDLCKTIYAYFCEEGIEITSENIINYLKDKKEYIQLMFDQIKENEK